MKEFVLKIDSWHFKIANFGGANAYRCTDICEYIRKFVLNLVAIILIAAIFVTFAGIFLYGFGNVIGWLFLDYVLEPVTLVFFMGSMALLAVAAYDRIMKALDNRKVVKKDPGFIGLAYDKFKNKTCSRIRFE